jgi:hypothetical protein
MRTTLIILTVVMAIAAFSLFVSAGIVNYLYTVRIGQYLRLADDASTPQTKRKYLEQYKDAVIENVKRENARYIFTQTRLTKTTQLEVLDTLILRLDDIAKLTPGSLAYQQGMEQVTGQEFDHTIGSVNGIFKSCYIRESFFLRYSPLSWGSACVLLGIFFGLWASFIDVI